jgi:hypothetical protein
LLFWLTAHCTAKQPTMYSLFQDPCVPLIAVS